MNYRALVLATITAATFVSSAALAGIGDYSPAVPVSAFARPAAWLDPSRLNFSTELSFGSYGGQSSGLQVMRMSYQIGTPLSMRVSVGNSFGGFRQQADGKFFLEGLDLAYHPFGNFQVNVSYRDIRSPLQYNRPGVFDPSYGAWR